MTYQSYSKIYDAKTRKYQKKYNFEIGKDLRCDMWNNESDAFRHAFASASLTTKIGSGVTKFLGDTHELWDRGGPNQQPDNEENMDKWNNQIGREIGVEIRKQFGDGVKNLSQEQLDDIVAAKVMQRMRKGDMIVHPDDKRQLKDYNKYMKNESTGQAAPVSRMSEAEINLIRQAANQPPVYWPAIHYLDNIQTSQMGRINGSSPVSEELGNYLDNLTPGDKVFHAGNEPIPLAVKKSEDVTQADIDECKAMYSQWNANGKTLPPKTEIETQVGSGGLIYVDNYVRSDGTQVSGYYRRK